MVSKSSSSISSSLRSRSSSISVIETLPLNSKTSTFRTRQLALSVDLFNVFNASTVLGRQYDVTATGNTGFNQPLEIMNPRLLRFGARFQF